MTMHQDAIIDGREELESIMLSIRMDALWKKMREIDIRLKSLELIDAEAAAALLKMYGELDS